MRCALLVVSVLIATPALALSPAHTPTPTPAPVDCPADRAGLGPQNYADGLIAEARSLGSDRFAETERLLRCAEHHLSAAGLDSNEASAELHQLQGTLDQTFRRYKLEFVKAYQSGDYPTAAAALVQMRDLMGDPHDDRTRYAEKHLKKVRTLAANDGIDLEIPPPPRRARRKVTRPATVRPPPTTPSDAVAAADALFTMHPLLVFFLGTLTGCLLTLAGVLARSSKEP